MVDLLTTRSIEVTKLALDGLMLRQKAITANTANVLSPDYIRKEVDFESQLKEIVKKDDLKQIIKSQNSMQYNLNTIPDSISVGSYSSGLTPQQKSYMNNNIYSDFSPHIVDDTLSAVGENGNNVTLEQETMDMAKTGTRYALLSILEQKSIKGLNDAIKGTGT